MFIDRVICSCVNEYTWIYLVMISDSLIELSAPVWMIDIDIHLVMISYSLIESSAPVWMILNDIHWCEWLSVIQKGADDSTNEYEIITRCISLSIIYTGADDSINESEIIIRCMSISIIHTGADDFINESEIMTFDLVGTRNSSIWWGQYSAQYSSHNIYHYQQFTLEQMILSMNLK